MPTSEQRPVPQPRAGEASEQVQPPARERSYVGDIGAPIQGAGDKAAVSFSMVLLAVVIGFVVGIAVWAALLLSTFLTNLVWDPVRAGGLPWFMPVIICTVGGLIVGAWGMLPHGEPIELEEVMEEGKRTGTYEMKGLGQSVVGFLLPLAFGGAVGPEAGLTGIVAGACYWIGDTLKAAGLRVKGLSEISMAATMSAVFRTPLLGLAVAEDGLPGDTPRPVEVTFRRKAKFVLYTASAFGAVAGVMALSALVGSEAGMPRFETVTVGAREVAWALPCMLVGFAFALVYHAANYAFSRLGKLLEPYRPLRGALCGLVLGLVGVVLPLVLFSGEEQAFEVMEEWQGLGATLLLVTAVVKLAANPLCMNLGWKGGNGFPTIFSGICCGYGLALLTGADPVFCVTVTTAAVVGGVMRNVGLVLGFLLLCFPLRSIVWLGLSAVICCYLPLPAPFAAPKAPAEE